MKNNCHINIDDVFICQVKDAAQTIDLFGEDYLEEHGCYLPPELLERALKAQEEMRLVHILLKAEKEKQEKDRY